MHLENRLMEDLTRVATDLHRAYLEESAPEPRGHALPDRKRVVELVGELRELLFPGHHGLFRGEGHDLTCLVERLGTLYWNLSRLIHDTVSHACPFPCDNGCNDFRESARQASEFLGQIPRIRQVLAQDIQSAYDGDPAAKSLDEVILAYPGLFAVMVYRVAHQLHLQGIRLMPRIMSEYAHTLTGIEIHPAAVIGHSFFIDHGTGVVIGETCEIGNNVKLYQGVTLGALSIPKDERGRALKSGKRHPTIEDDVVIYAGATILGGKTVVGRGAVIGGNVWLTESVPADSKVINRPTIEMR